MQDLARKLGITAGQTICLLDAPAPSAVLLRAVCPPDVTVVEGATGRRYDAIFCWPVSLVHLTERMVALAGRIIPAGAIWVVMPNKRHAAARGITYTWEEMQAAVLRTDLVDNKIVSLSAEEYATRFVIRKDRRPGYT